MKHIHGKSRLLKVCITATALLLAGCESSEETAVDVVETPSGKAPVSPAMVRELDRLSELMLIKDYVALEDTQFRWLESREQLCSTSIETLTDDNDIAAKLIECRDGLDAIRMQELRQIHLPLLLAGSAPATAGTSKQPGPLEYEATQLASAMQYTSVSNSIAMGGGPNVSLRAFDDGDQLIAFDAHKRSVSNIAVSPNGKLLVTGSRHDPMLKFWDAATGLLLNEIDVAHNDASFAFLADGKGLLVGAGRLRHLDLQNNRLRPVPFASGIATAFAINETFAAVGMRSGEIELFTFRREGGALEFKPQASGTAGVRRGSVVALSFSPDSQHLISVNRTGAIEQWLIPGMEKLRSSQSELAFVGYMAPTNNHEIIYLSGNVAERGNAKGRILALDLNNGIAKRIYEEALTNSPAIQLNEAARTLIIADSRTIKYMPVPTDRSAFEVMPSIGMRALTDIPTADTKLILRSVGTSRPVLEGVADEAKVHVFGVYQGVLENGKKRGFRQHPQGQVTVNVGGAGRAILVLTAYEPVKWTIRNRGVTVDKVLLWGHSEQEVVGAHPSTRVYSNLQTSAGTSSLYAYKRDGNYNKLVRAVAEITGKEIDTFQGKYEAASFSLNVSPGQGATSEANGIQKWTDEDGVVHYGDATTNPPR